MTVDRQQMSCYASAVGIKDSLNKALQGAKDLAQSTGDAFMQTQWPLIEEKLLALLQDLATRCSDANAGAKEAFGKHWPKVQAYFDQTAKPTLVDMIKNDSVFDVIIEIFYDQLPRTLRRRLRPELMREFCQQHRLKMLARLQSTSPNNERQPLG